MRITKAAARLFYDRFHLQGGISSRMGATLGLIYDGQLVAAMTCNTAAVCRSTGRWLVQRFATHGSVPGAASRLLTAFRRLRPEEPLTTFSDPRYSDGAVYRTLGFTCETPKPQRDYYYLRDGQAYPKNQKQKRYLVRELKHRGMPVDELETEYEMAARLGYERVFTPGKVRWVLYPDT